MSSAAIEKRALSSTSTSQVYPRLLMLVFGPVATENPSRLRDDRVASTVPYETDIAAYEPLSPFADDDQLSMSAESGGMGTPSFPQAVEAMLRAAGWHRGRRIEVAPLRKAIEENGYAVSGAAEQLLSEFEGLKVVDNAHWMLFNALRTASEFDNDDIHNLENILQESVCPLAIMSSAYVFVGSSGRVFVLDQDWLFVKIVRSIVELLTLIASPGQVTPTTVALAVSERPLDLR